MASGVFKLFEGDLAGKKTSTCCPVFGMAQRNGPMLLPLKTKTILALTGAECI